MRSLLQKYFEHQIQASSVPVSDLEANEEDVFLGGNPMETEAYSMHPMPVYNNIQETRRRDRRGGDPMLFQGFGYPPMR